MYSSIHGSILFSYCCWVNLFSFWFLNWLIPSLFARRPSSRAYWLWKQLHLVFSSFLFNSVHVYGKSIHGEKMHISQPWRQPKFFFLSNLVIVFTLNVFAQRPLYCELRTFVRIWITWEQRKQSVLQFCFHIWEIYGSSTTSFIGKKDIGYKNSIKGGYSSQCEKYLIVNKLLTK